MLLPDALYNLISMEIYTMNLITKLDAWKQVTEVPAELANPTQLEPNKMHEGTQITDSLGRVTNIQYTQDPTIREYESATMVYMKTINDRENPLLVLPKHTVLVRETNEEGQGIIKSLGTFGYKHDGETVMLDWDLGKKAKVGETDGKPMYQFIKVESHLSQQWINAVVDGGRALGLNNETVLDGVKGIRNYLLNPDYHTFYVMDNRTQVSSQSTSDLASIL